MRGSIRPNLARYFEKLRYSYGARERAGLYSFLQKARDVGQLERVPELRFVTPVAARILGRVEREDARAGERHV